MDTQTKLAMKMQKAITIIQFKLEGQLIKKHPEYKMDNRCLLDKINLQNGTVAIDGKEYDMLDCNFPTISLDNPYKLTNEEQLVIDKLTSSFMHCSKLKSILIYYCKKEVYIKYATIISYFMAVYL